MQTQIIYRPRIRRLGEHRWLIESRTQQGLGHQVNLQRGSCSCQAGKHGHPTCSHRRLAAQCERAYQQMRAQIEAQRIRRPAGMAGLLDAFG